MASPRWAECCWGCSTADEGTVTFDGRDVVGAKGRDLQALRREMQIVFQDPFSSLDPRATVGDSIAEGLRAQGVGAAARRDRVAEVLDLVGLEPYHARRYPHQFSGGQRQRVGIARALAVEPRFLVADEPVSALDVSIQSQILNLLRDLQARLDFTLVFVAHDLAVVEHLCDRVAVMYLGRIAEIGTRDRVFGRPEHPYTEALLSSIPVADPERPGSATGSRASCPARSTPRPGARSTPAARWRSPACATRRCPGCCPPPSTPTTSRPATCAPARIRTWTAPDADLRSLVG